MDLSPNCVSKRRKGLYSQPRSLVAAPAFMLLGLLRSPPCRHSNWKCVEIGDAPLALFYQIISVQPANVHVVVILLAYHKLPLMFVYSWPVVGLWISGNNIYDSGFHTFISSTRTFPLVETRARQKHQIQSTNGLKWIQIPSEGGYEHLIWRSKTKKLYEHDMIKRISHIFCASMILYS